MPTYEIACFPCEDIFEVTCLISDRDNLHPCPNCGTTSNERLMAAPHVMRAAQIDSFRRGPAYEEYKKIARLKSARANLAPDKREAVNSEIKERTEVASRKKDKTSVQKG